MYASRIAGIVLLCGALACASSGGRAQGDQPAARTDRNILRTADLTEAQKDLTVLQVIRQLRPHFLAGSGALTTGNAGLIVYQDDSRLGGVSTLGEVRMREVIEVRYLSASEASGRYGLGHEGGVVAIRRRR